MILVNHLRKVDRNLIKPRVHNHPKKKNCHLELQTTSFPNGIELAVHRTSDSKVTAEMLAAGPAAIMNDKELMQTWYQDILARRYTVELVNAANSHETII